MHLYLRHLPQGRVSGWTYEKLRAGDEVDISPAMGPCFYLLGNGEQGLPLIGTGLAPLYGILRDALLFRPCPWDIVRLSPVFHSHASRDGSAGLPARLIRSACHRFDYCTIAPLAAAGSATDGGFAAPV